jgi:hypothetical protein
MGEGVDVKLERFKSSMKRVGGDNTVQAVLNLPLREPVGATLCGGPYLRNSI